MLVRVVDSLNGTPVQVRDWDFCAHRLTLRELLRERVRREVETFNLHRPEIYHGLVEAAEFERTVNGTSVKRFRSLDPDREFDRALEAFRTNGILILAGGRQIDSLDDEIDLD